MFEADLAGKLPEIAAYEDHLTSCVFGALKCLPPDSGLGPVLRAATKHATDGCLGDLLDGKGIRLQEPEEAQLLFWPRSSEYGEPDLVLILKGQSESFIVPIEVKFFSAKHGEEEDDQLARYYEALATFEGRQTFNCEAIGGFSGELLALIYVTRFRAEQEIEETLRQLDYRGMGEARDRIFHLKWQEVHRVVGELCEAEKDPYRRTVLCDTKGLLEHKGLTRFTGFSSIPLALSEEDLVHVPAFLECQEARRRGFSHFPTLPESLPPEVLRRRPIYLQMGNG